MAEVQPDERYELVQYALTVAGLLALGYCLAVFVEAKLYQARESRSFAKELRLHKARAATASRSGCPSPVAP